MRCYYLTGDGKCEGRYKGFACIGAKCRAEKDPPCEHYDKGFYCLKYRRFGCPGLTKCNEEHALIPARTRREKAKA